MCRLLSADPCSSACTVRTNCQPLRATAEQYLCRRIELVHPDVLHVSLENGLGGALVLSEVQAASEGAGHQPCEPIRGPKSKLHLR
jgi:hypothetical protein